MFMKTFEEQWTAWLDDKLPESELAAFEASLPDLAAAQAEKRAAQKLRAILKEQLSSRAMSNAEFFSHQLREQINRETAAPPQKFATGWTIRRLFWTGATSFAVFLICTFFVLREKGPGDQSQYLSQVLNARVDPVVSPNASISMFESKESRVTVLWVEGLQTLPSEYATK
jgi:anti-sigma factor RsiW